MRTKIVLLFSLTFVLLAAYLSAQPQPESAKVRVALVDAETGRPMAGIIRVRAGDAVQKIPELLDRLRGLKPPAEFAGWYVVPAGGAEVTLPRRTLNIEALSGLETTLRREEVDVQKVPGEIRIKLSACFRPEASQLAAGNTHLHLRNMALADADDYLRQIPAADGLRVQFISYLERDKDDVDYITNKYPLGNLTQFNTSGVLINNGEEHRHNFKGFGEGYGHVMFLNIKELIKPVSIGPGIMATGFDDTPLRPGLDNARKQGGTIIWCHNNFGQEDILSALSGRLDAMNVFDGSRRGNFEENYYHYLNVGIRLPISTGTDWFMYDFARVYARLTGTLTIDDWLNAVKAGRCQATNGPLLSLEVDGKEIGSVINVNEPKAVEIAARAVGRHDFQSLQLIHNGKVIKTVPVDGKSPFTAALTHKVRIDEPGWFAVRIDSQTKNELGQELFAHTSPVYVDFGGKRRFDVDAARALLKQIAEGEGAIQMQGMFSNPTARQNVLALYQTAVRELQQRIERR